MLRADANILLHPFFLFAGNEQVCRETTGLKFKTKAPLLVSMNFAFLGLWFDSIPAEWAGFPVWGRERGLMELALGSSSGRCLWLGGAGPGL